MFSSHRVGSFLKKWFNGQQRFGNLIRLSLFIGPANPASILPISDKLDLDFPPECLF
jgi:hypothetical protein